MTFQTGSQAPRPSAFDAGLFYCPYVPLAFANTVPVEENPAVHHDPILISFIRHIHPNTIAHDLVGVQPMTAPAGEIFSLRYSYTEPEPTPDWCVGSLK
jgi:hypothetical protein